MAYVEPSAFDDKEVILVYLAGTTAEAKKVEETLTEQGISYTLKAEAFDQVGLFLRTGAMPGVGFYVLSGQANFCRSLLRSRKLRAGVVEESM